MLSNSSIAPDPPTKTTASKLSMSNSSINISVRTSPPNLPIALFSLDTDLILFPCFSNTSFVIKYSSSLKSLEARIIASKDFRDEEYFITKEVLEKQGKNIPHL